MATGMEIAGVILASFPLIVSALEHYGEGLQSMQDWARFRTHFNGFLNAFIRQQIFFRQHIEDLLSTVVDSEYHMGCMLDDLEDPQWKDPRLEGKLKKRLPGNREYESYMTTVLAIFDVLNKIRKKLNITDDKVSLFFALCANGTTLKRLIVSHLAALVPSQSKGLLPY
jgi:hypothetical protein